MTILQKYIAGKLDTAAQEITDALVPKYIAEFEAMLNKVANRLIKNLPADLVIDDKDDHIEVTINDSKKVESKHD